MPSLYQAQQHLEDGNSEAAREIVEAVLRERPNDRQALALLSHLNAADQQIVITEPQHVIGEKIGTALGEHYVSREADSIIPMPTGDDVDGMIAGLAKGFMTLALLFGIIAIVIGLYRVGIEQGLSIQINIQQMFLALNEIASGPSGQCMALLVVLGFTSLMFKAVAK